jgi:preprotein translocase subunit SecD
MNNLRWRILLIVVIIGACLWAIIPPGKKIRLGLDLKGGVHLVLRVDTEEALKLETTTSSERFREALESAGVTGVTVTVLSPTGFQVTGVQPAQDAIFRQTAVDLQAMFDRQPGAGGSTFTMKPNVARDLKIATVVQARMTIERRVNELGVAEPIIAQQGTEQDYLLVQLPGVTDVDRAKSVIQSIAMLELKLVEQGPAPTRESLLQASGGQEPPGTEVLPGAQDRAQAGSATPQTVFYLVRKVPVLTGRDLRSAKQGPDQYNQPAVHFEVKGDAATRFGKSTGENINRLLAIVLDKTIVSAPNIEGRISDQGQISGSFTMQEAEDLALKLRSGALPAPLTYMQETTIGPTLGQDSINSGVLASLISLAGVTVFMLVFYRLSGVNAIVALVGNLIILLGAMSYINATMTLPGIAGFVLTMGMGVDSNVLIFERIKEEMQDGRGVRAALNAGFTRVFLTLVDTHLAALIGAAFLFQFGTGPIRGFATTLFFGLVSNLFTSTFVSKTLFEVVLSRRHAETLSI